MENNLNQNKNNKKKKILTAVLSLALVAAIAIGVTLAYLFSKTETKENVFTFANNISGKLDEPKWNPKDAENLIPGKKIDKDPQLTNTSTNAVVEYGAVRLTFQNGKGQDLSAADTATLMTLIDIDWSRNWTLMPGTATKNDVKQVYVFNNTIPQNVTTDPVFYSVTIKESITPAQLLWLAGDYGHTAACYVFGLHDATHPVDPTICTITYRHHEKCALFTGTATAAQIEATPRGGSVGGKTCDCTPAEVHSPNCPSMIGTIPVDANGQFTCGHNTLVSGIGNFTIKVEGAVVQADAFNSAAEAAPDLVSMFS